MLRRRPGLGTDTLSWQSSIVAVMSSCRCPRGVRVSPSWRAAHATRAAPLAELLRQPIQEDADRVDHHGGHHNDARVPKGWETLGRVMRGVGVSWWTRA